MHGALGWGWHKSHHEPHEPGLEKNDLYAVVFALFAIGLFWIGGNFWQPLWWVAAGITVYGVLYFVAHDGLVHQRWPFRYVPRKGYLKRLYQAHRLHHAVDGKDGCVSFGFIYAPPVDELVKELADNRKLQGGRAAPTPESTGAGSPRH
jgi:beta-carotene 3-hydroxylase